MRAADLHGPTPSETIQLLAPHGQCHRAFGLASNQVASNSHTTADGLLVGLCLRCAVLRSFIPKMREAGWLVHICTTRGGYLRLMEHFAVCEAQHHRYSDAQVVTVWEALAQLRVHVCC
jgi:hypothetical protein